MALKWKCAGLTLLVGFLRWCSVVIGLPYFVFKGLKFYWLESVKVPMLPRLVGLAYTLAAELCLALVYLTCQPVAVLQSAWNFAIYKETK